MSKERPARRASGNRRVVRTRRSPVSNRHPVITQSLRRIRNITEVCPGKPTNNRAEIFAILRALENAPRNIETLIIKTDSKYCIGCFSSWHREWERHGWKTAKGEPVGNQVGGAFSFGVLLIDLSN